ncbi:hypothetical protein VTN00DRAFT_8105 [Thermoascus crustaceus]|uniref:uncharacterized protein n=1 Tax=Thermoascus crustaceus TaxID=5088 RepID=UPI00374462CF
MPRKDFLRDLRGACLPEKYPHLTDIRAGDDDGVIAFTYVNHGVTIHLEALISDLSCYPNDHGYFAYTTSEGVPSAVAATIQEIQPLLTGLSVSDFLSNLSDAVTNTLSPNTQTSDADGDIEMHDCSDLSDNEDEYEWDIHSPQHHEFEDDLSDGGLFSSMEDKEVKAKIREDMRTVKNAGFKTGFLGWLNGPIVISVSCRIAKLGISDEAMQAWGVQPQQYLVLLIRYPNGYRDIDQIFHEDASTSKPSIEMHVALCDSYKPTLAEAMKVFNQGAAEGNAPAEGEDLRKLSPSFISRPLNALLNERFVKIAKYRCTFGFGWSGAELFFNDVQGKSLGSADPGDPKYSMEDALDSSNSGFPKQLTSDHIIENNSPRRLSFPLLAMQFTLRHFVRCTEFCLVCHCKVNAGFEALKPYVCSKALCLYQYMALGFGPSLEWEIISQPNVVDLLVSFTYASAANGRLKDFPTGLGILVPETTEYLHDLTSSSPSQFTSQGSQYSPSSSSSPASKSALRPYEAKLDRKNMELLFPDIRDSPPVRTGDWIVIITHASSEGPAEIQPHCRVEDTGLWPTVKLSTPIIRGKHPEKWSSTAPKGRAPVFEPVEFVVYDKNFDELKNDQKHAAIVMLLETLPDVEQMKAYLMENKHSSPEPLLASWKEKISKSALDILRWIVASNRSCIIQDDDLSQSEDANENLVSGMEGYMQFRFAQGAPDKEQRFVDSVNVATAQFNLKYPTIFAWHGSDLSNWHSIVREGLHFKEVLHGRAYGDGVYMSTCFDVSYGYMGYYSGTPTWPKSKLKISSAISLNEVVNAPSKFVSKNPHLVVNRLDWIQSRYLFVKCLASAPTTTVRKIKPATMFYEQDPSYTAQGPKNSPVVIPITAISQRRRQLVKNNGSNKKASPTHGTKRTLFGRSARNEDDDTGSVETDHEDLLALLSDCEDENDSKIVKTEHGPSKPATDKSSQSKGGPHDPSPKTDFKPGTLDGSSLPLLAPPSYATISATKALQRDLKTTLKVQDAQPLHELGWYIDPNLISTVYQWIVELHSFDPSIPLAADLKAAGLQSVVLELRFSKDYPISPPFVRVIRPRFLPFMAGGGGHVTAGGALCMELLTNTGWSAASSIESVLLQVRMAISSTDPSPARLERSQGKGKVREYAVGEAVDAYVRACRTHGWEIPKDFEQTNRAQWSLVSSATKN